METLGLGPDAAPERLRRRVDDLPDGTLNIRWSIVWQAVFYIVAIVSIYVSLTSRLSGMEAKVNDLQVDVTQIKTLLMQGRH